MKHGKKHKKRKKRIEKLKHFLLKLIPTLAIIVGLGISLLSYGVLGCIGTFIIVKATNIEIDEEDDEVEEFDTYGKKIGQKIIIDNVLYIIGGIATIVGCFIYGYYYGIVLGVISLVYGIKKLFDTVPGYVIVHC